MLTIKRNGKVYQLQIAKSRLVNPDLTAMQSKPDAVAPVAETPPATEVDVTQPSAKKVAVKEPRPYWIRPRDDEEREKLVLDYDVELIVDRSISMAEEMALAR